MADKRGFVGVFDSGIGGISVLRRLVDQLPHEDFVYVGDGAHNPYGSKSSEQILGYSRDIVRHLASCGAKAVVIACNTATSVALARLRDEFADLTFVGVEPALKPATERVPHDSILVMATQVTLALDKFQRLARAYGSDSDVVAVPCVGLAHRIEQGDLDAPDLQDLLTELVGAYRGKVDSVVLGCTHYPFVARQIRAVVGDVPFFDGAAGTARRLASLLGERDLLADDRQQGSVTFLSTLHEPGVLERYQEFFAMPLDPDASCA
ncbi:glutamate racemase [Olsenella massiliensis]|uniref:glutamate racemase n=1 Tax=Olsenella massiliensis TaxID=1622075 RepID=UPI00071DBC72|nr:glutamate racemase [Olsenella massiliensis]